ncbi:hypothetical protein Cgig2_011421 [Carnegiea gigantea]|uniref:WRKY domain-containing protein n=1 Tax=Carnegiea gigantea TaxID=171969 RepID=A0A9Q1QQN6_9CARY|nr:hypothetical protein Cgig2_011421 [Carnegiea gigantea]
MARDIALCSITPVPILLSIMDRNYQTTTPMTTTTFSSLESSGSDQYIEGTDFEVSEFFSNFEEWGMAETESMGFTGQSQDFGYQGNQFYDQFGGSSNQQQNVEESSRGGSRNSREKKDDRGRIAFRMRSEIDVVEDGYKWRKYGKKMVKNSPNPRNYYRCSVEGCPVKKRVERDKEDPHYVITTYEGIHSHEAPRQ